MHSFSVLVGVALSDALVAAPPPSSAAAASDAAASFAQEEAVGRAAAEPALVARNRLRGQGRGGARLFTKDGQVACQGGFGDAGGEGNLCVWPGSHLRMRGLMRWPDGRVQRRRALEEDRGEGYDDADGPLPDLGPATHLQLRAGDVVLAHHLLAHCGGPNLGAEIRYMLYFRVRHADWASMVERRDLANDLWCDLPGVKPVLELP